MLLLAVHLPGTIAQAQDDDSASAPDQTSIDPSWRPDRPVTQGRTGWSASASRNWASAVHASFAGGARYARYPSYGRVRRVSDEMQTAEGNPAVAPGSDETAIPLPENGYTEDDPAYFENDPRFARTVNGPYFDGICDGPDVCGGDCWGWPCGTCLGLLHGRVWVGADYLLWWMKGTEVPPLVSTGALNVGATQVLFGGTAIDDNAVSGGRLNFGFWIDPCQMVGLEADYLALGKAVTHFDAASPPLATLGRPFLNVLTGLPGFAVIGSPGVATGSISIVGTSEFQGFEVLLRRALYRGCRARADFLIGYRFDRLDDSLEISDQLTSIDPFSIIPVGTKIASNDLFRTTNQFNGGEFGVATSWRHCAWSLQGVIKVALGNTHSRVDIHGTTTVDGAPAPDPGGLLALPSNMGTFQKDNFAMIPELGLTLGRDLTCRLRATVGYSLVYWSKVMRAGEQIDLNLNPNQFPYPAPAPGGPPEPQFRAVTTDFWAQGLNFGLDFRF